jgi:CubicO group peptidase (beta-lactamase class C family)
VGVDPQKLEALFERAEREVREGLLPSVQIAVAREGKIAGMRSFGTVTHEGRPAAATNETLYAVFSSTKAITSAAAWLLIQEGVLSIGERVADIVPGFGENGKERITVEQVLTHTSGFPHAPLGPPEWYAPEQRLQRYANWKLSFDPGTRYEYHPSSGMWVIAEIVTRRSGIEFRRFVRQRIAEPLGLPDLFVGLPQGENGRVADIVHVGEEITDAELAERGLPKVPETEVTEENLERFNLPEVRALGVPGGGGIMTAAELALFYQALLNNGRARDGVQIWQPAGLLKAREIRTGDLVDPVFRKRANRGLGLVIAGDRDRNYRGFGHTGSEEMFGHNGAGGQIAWGDPESGLSLGYCTNGFDRNWLRLGRRTVGISSRAALLAT